MVLQSLMCGPITRGFASEDDAVANGQGQADEESTEPAQTEETPGGTAENVQNQSDDSESQAGNESGQSQDASTQGAEGTSNDSAITEGEENQQAEVGNDGEGTPDSEATADPARVILRVHKEVTGDDYTNDEQYTFELKAVEEAPMPEADSSIKVSAGNTGDFGEIAYTAPGSYYYTITEVAPE